MNQYKRLLSIYAMLLITLIAIAQNGSNSPYTRYGFGQLSDQSFGNSKAMGGLAIGLRNKYQINAANPASYSAVDSLTFLFDAGMSLQNTNFNENGYKTNAKNSTVDYIAMQFRLYKGLGITAGFLPYSIVGYNYMIPDKKMSAYSNYSGEGGAQQIFIGLGYEIIKNFSIGANVSYIYGDITHTVNTTFNNTDAYISLWRENISLSDFKLDLGFQYTHNLNEKHNITLGAIYSFSKDVNSDANLYIEKYNSSSVLLNQDIKTIDNACGIPESFGLGITYNYDNRLTIGLDYASQKWGSVKYPKNQQGQYSSIEGLFSDRTKIAAGAEYLPDPYSRNLFKRVRYRMGAYYSTPYAKINEKEGAKEYGISLGFGLPIFQSKSILNISGQYVKVSPKVSGMLEENTLRVNVGLTFNERWFMKWKVN
jgi:hypothetical protein